MTRGFKAETFDHIYPLDQEWLWSNRMPAGEMTILAAAGGTGKGLMCAWLISAITNGWPLPDGGPPVPAQNVLWASTEDDRHITMANRLLACGANDERVGDISRINGRPISLPDDMAQLSEAVTNMGNVGLVVLDPLSKIAGNSVGTRNSTNKTMVPLQQWVNDTGVPILWVHHVNRDGDVNGSKAVVDSVRSVLTLEREKNQPNIRSLHVAKSNGGDEDAPDLSFTIEGEGPSTHIKWVMQADDNAPEGLALALKAVKATGKPVSGRSVAEATGIPYGTVRVMLARLAADGKVVSPASGWYAGSDGK